ncbi:MAG: hypothetical protein J1F11_06525 [Oscillospiraceae bacterium]|nr:hypothetical protein [Oscillospiraceae bacterium]
MFCSRCGRELRDGEVCSCTETSGNNNASSSPLPDSKAIIEGAKHAAEALRNDPMVSEVIDTIKGVTVSPVQQVSENAYRTDILWLILTVLESAMVSFGITAMLRRGSYALVTLFGIKADYSEYAKELNDLGLSPLKIFGAEFLCALVSFIASMLIISAMMTISKRRTGFFAAANMTVTAFLPSSMLIAAAGVLSFVHIVPGLAAVFAAVVSAILLGFVGMQSLGRFESPPFRRYILYMLLFCTVNILAEIIFLGPLIGGSMS